ncbi:hypothetical protein, partial [Burkholderia dolosa]|uniref:hypothetical protein n=1 Tax=Burkholderia dolosa TaxID=152500 RepID=UPI001C961DE8
MLYVDAANGLEKLFNDSAKECEKPADTSLSELLCVRHKLMAKEPRYATQTQGRSAGRTGQGLEPGPGT